MQQKIKEESVFFPVREVPAVGIPHNTGKEIDCTVYKFIVKKTSNQIL